MFGIVGWAATESARPGIACSPRRTRYSSRPQGESGRIAGAPVPYDSATSGNVGTNVPALTGTTNQGAPWRLHIGRLFMRRIISLAAILIAIVAMQGPLYAQGSAQGAILGTVTDSSGAVVPGGAVI